MYRHILSLKGFSFQNYCKDARVSEMIDSKNRMNTCNTFNFNE